MTIFSSFKALQSHVINFQRKCDLLFKSELEEKTCSFCQIEFDSVVTAVNHLSESCVANDSINGMSSEIEGILKNRSNPTRKRKYNKKSIYWSAEKQNDSDSITLNFDDKTTIIFE